MEKEKEKEKEIEKIKILALGNSSVGKSSFILRLTENIFFDEIKATIGIGFFTKVIQLKDGEKYKVLFYDTAGQEKYKSISFSHIKNADGILLMYDITSRESFKDISNWMNDIKDNKGENFPLILIGNKIDLNDKRQIKFEEGKKLADYYGIPFMETSNKDGKNIENATYALINDIVGKKEDLLNTYEVIELSKSERFQLERDSKLFEEKRQSGCCHSNKNHKSTS